MVNCFQYSIQLTIDKGSAKICTSCIH